MRYIFNNYLLDTDRFELLCDGEPVSLEPQVFEVLAYLVQHPDRLVTKDELFEHVWPRGFIGDAALNSRVMAARRAIGDSGREQRLVRTVHGRGIASLALSPLLRPSRTMPSR